MDAHQPVLLTEVLEQLAVRADGIYVDATFGRGGHARGILDRLDPSGRLLALDRDPEAVAAAERAFDGDTRFTIFRESFAMLERVAQDQHVTGRVDGILADLGVSSPQLDDPSRGFSFSTDGPLDMRMDPDSGIPASEWLCRVDEQELTQVLRDYGEERFAKRVARALVARAATGGLTRTSELAATVAAAIPSREPGKHPATRAFQAIRIAVNAELEQLDALLEASPRVLRVGGRLCVIAFHSLEDRAVKRFLRGPGEPPGPRGLPRAQRRSPYLHAVGRPLRPGVTETAGNPRARSATLRVGERVE